MASHILIIEDEAAVRRLMTLALETAGYEVTSAEDGETGLTRFGDGSRWTAVLLDQRMPGMDGLTTLTQLRERRPEAVVIMVTAFGSIELAVDAMKLGATDFLRKPLTPDVLRKAVAAATRVRPAAAAAAPRAPEAFARPDIETLTMNGFHFVSERADVQGAYTFRVFAGDDLGHGALVSVGIEPAAVARVERITGRRLPVTSSFWQVQAENLLAAYLWTEQRIPEPDALRVRDVSRDDMASAAAWAE